MLTDQSSFGCYTLMEPIRFFCVGSTDENQLALISTYRVIRYEDIYEIETRHTKFARRYFSSNSTLNQLNFIVKKKIIMQNATLLIEQQFV